MDDRPDLGVKAMPVGMRHIGTTGKIKFATLTVAPANAGAHNHRPLFCEGRFPSCPIDGLRGMGPCVRTAFAGTTWRKLSMRRESPPRPSVTTDSAARTETLRPVATWRAYHRSGIHWPQTLTGISTR